MKASPPIPLRSRPCLPYITTQIKHGRNKDTRKGTRLAGMKLKEFQFRRIQRPGASLSIFDGEKEVAMGFVGEVLKTPAVIALAEREIRSTNWYFGTFVIRLKGGEQ